MEFDIKKAEKYAKKVSHLSMIPDFYCRHNADDYDIYIMTPLTEYLKRDADMLYSMFLSLDDD